MTLSQRDRVPKNIKESLPKVYIGEAMYVVIVYDVAVDRVNKVKKFLRQYLHWVQNSVFEGEITLAEFERIKAGIKELIDEDEDSIVIYKLRSMPKRETIGIEKNPLDDII
jgi:CRISPR-associated protein Cas2